MKFLIHFFTWVTLFVLCSCKGNLRGKEYFEWVRDYKNGYHVKTESTDLIIDLQYQPSKYVWMQQNGEFQEASFKKDKPSLDSMQYFTLTITGKNGGDFISNNSSNETDKQKRLYYFSFLFQNDISLKDGEETLPCVLYHFERNEDINNSRSFVLGFENNVKVNKDVQLLIGANELGIEPFVIKIQKESNSLFDL